jgi:2-furoyl-CoA dehydrogenase large subunit
VIESPAPAFAAAVGTTRYVGEPVVVVAARDRYVAEDALELVDVEYEPLEPALDPVAEALAGRTLSDRSFGYGDVDAAFAHAHTVVRHRVRFPRWSCTPVEGYCVVCDWDAAGGSLTAWANFQGPFTLHAVAAAALGLPGTKLRLVTPPDSGGSFGIKSGVFAAVVLMGVVSRALGVPVRWTEDRLEHLTASQVATDRTTEVEAAFAADGELLGLRYDVIEDVGAFARAPEPATLYRMHGSLTGAYRVRAVAARNRIVSTNRAPTGLNRGFGGPQLYLALERVMAIGARRLSLDPVVLARRNLVERDAFPYRTPTGALYDSGDYGACVDDALALARYEERRAEQARARAEGRLVGVGLACVVEPSISNMGYVTLARPADQRARGLPISGNAEGAQIQVTPSGGVAVRLATTPQGQGHRTVAAQVVADVLGVTPAEVEVDLQADTSTSPWTIASGAYSSRFSGMGAGAAHVAAARLADKLRRIAAHQLECSADDIELVGGGARVRGNPERSISLRRLASAAHWSPESLPAGEEPGLAVIAYHKAPNLDPPDADDRVASSAVHGFICDVCTVEVDRVTGQVHVLDYVTVHDAGRMLNPLIVHGQVTGGFVHGLAPALLERQLHDEDGNVLTGSLMDYLCVTSTEVPPLTIGHRETPSPLTPLGAKGLGEGNTMSVPVAIANAVADALGSDDVELPLTPSRVWELTAREEPAGP